MFDSIFVIPLIEKDTSPSDKMVKGNFFDKEDMNVTYSHTDPPPLPVLSTIERENSNNEYKMLRKKSNIPSLKMRPKCGDIERGKQLQIQNQEKDDIIIDSHDAIMSSDIECPICLDHYGKLLFRKVKVYDDIDC